MSHDVNVTLETELRARVEELEVSLGALSGLASRCYEDALLLSRQLGGGDHRAGFWSSRVIMPDDDEIPF
jgi:hypothetical protein